MFTCRGPAKWARLGDLNTATDSDDAQTMIARIAQRYDHPGYDAVQLYNDIALYKLEREIKLSPYLRPICLDSGDKDVKSAVATGWGHTEWGKPMRNLFLTFNLDRLGEIYSV